MPSLWKTFVANEVLTASNVNDALNPNTAPHLARAVHAQKVDYGQKSGVSFQATVNFPAGRFSAAPVVVATLDNAAGGSQYIQVIVNGVSATSVTLVFIATNGNLSGSWCTATLIAMQV